MANVARAPGASIYQFADAGITSVEWTDIDTVRITSDFVAHAADFLRELFAND